MSHIKSKIKEDYIYIYRILIGVMKSCGYLGHLRKQVRSERDQGGPSPDGEDGSEPQGFVPKGPCRY